MNKPIRHGEVMLSPVKEIPAGKTNEHDLYIVGHSGTGHHHVLQSPTKFEVTEADSALYLRLFKPSELVHKKTVNRHHNLTVPAGLYKVTRKNEYDPFQKIMRQVWD